MKEGYRGEWDTMTVKELGEYLPQVMSLNWFEGVYIARQSMNGSQLDFYSYGIIANQSEMTITRLKMPLKKSTKTTNYFLPASQEKEVYLGR